MTTCRRSVLAFLLLLASALSKRTHPRQKVHLAIHANTGDGEAWLSRTNRTAVLGASKKPSENLVLNHTLPDSRYNATKGIRHHAGAELAISGRSMPITKENQYFAKTSVVELNHSNLKQEQTASRQFRDGSKSAYTAQLAKVVVHDVETLAYTSFRVLLVVLVILALVWFLRKCFERFDIRQIRGIGPFLMYIGYDEFDSFTQSFLIENVEYTGKVSMAIRIACGRNVVQTEFTSTSHQVGSYPVHQTMQIRIPQGSSQIVISAVHKSKDCGTLASKILSIKDVQKLGKMKKKKTLTLSRRRKGLVTELSSDVKVNLTFFTHPDASEGGLEEHNLSPEMQMLLRSRGSKDVTSSADGRECSLGANDADSHSDGGRQGRQDSLAELANNLNLLASACKGPLKKTTGVLGRNKEHYMVVYRGNKEGKPRKFSPGSHADLLGWHFGWWSDEGSFTKGMDPIGSIPMLRITNVYILPEGKTSDFCIRYVGKRKIKEGLVLRKLDRSREVWVECLHLFLEHLWKIKKQVASSSKEKKDSSVNNLSESSAHEMSSDGNAECAWGS